MTHLTIFQAIQLFSRTSDGYCQLASAYATYLSSNKRHIEAAVLFQRSGDNVQALEAFVMAGDWREALCTAYKLGKSNHVKNLR